MFVCLQKDTKHSVLTQRSIILIVLAHSCSSTAKWLVADQNNGPNGALYQPCIVLHLFRDEQASQSHEV